MEKFVYSPEWRLGGSSVYPNTPIRPPMAVQKYYQKRHRDFRCRSHHFKLNRDNDCLSGASNGRVEIFACVSSSSNHEATTVGVNPPFRAPTRSVIDSPLLWVGVGVGLSAVFSFAANNIKKYTMQQTFRTMMGNMPSSHDGQKDAATSSGSSFPLPSAVDQPLPSSQPARSHAVVDVDITGQNVGAGPVPGTTPSGREDVGKTEEKETAFVDVSPKILQKHSIKSLEELADARSPVGVWSKEMPSRDGGRIFGDHVHPPGADSLLSVETLENMLEDPTVQKMVYPYLPEDMRNPSTFKGMLQNPQYRDQMQAMLNKMSGSLELDKCMMDSLKNFNPNSPDVKQQFAQIGLTPEEALSRIMANPDVALAFQNPKIQAAIVECSQNPLSISKFQNDKEVMDVFNKISELFPGMTGPN